MKATEGLGRGEGVGVVSGIGTYDLWVKGIVASAFHLTVLARLPL